MSPAIFNLLQYHQRLDGQIRAEFRGRQPDITRIQKLKKLKQAVKARLNHIAMRGSPDPAI